MAATALLGIGASILGANAQKKAAKSASNAQVKAAQLGVDEQKRQFDMVRTLMQPFVGAGMQGLQGQLDLIGLGAEGSQQAALDNITGGAEYNTLVGQGENALLQNAAATGGLRGGNTAGALSHLRPDILNSLVNKRYDQLGGLTTLGQNSAAGVGAAGQNMANQNAALYGQQGAAQAGSALAQGTANQNMYSGIANTLGGLIGQNQGGNQGNLGTLFQNWGF